MISKLRLLMVTITVKVNLGVVDNIHLGSTIATQKALL